MNSLNEAWEKTGDNAMTLFVYGENNRVLSTHVYDFASSMLQVKTEAGKSYSEKFGEGGATPGRVAQARKKLDIMLRFEARRDGKLGAYTADVFKKGLTRDVHAPERATFKKRSRVVP